MEPILFLLRKSLKNIIKRIARKPLVLVGYILLFLFFILFIVIIVIMPQETGNLGTDDQFGAIATIAVLLVFYFGIKSGIERGSSFFRYSDVNFLFTSPVSPKKILLYGFIKQSMMSFLVVIIIMFQIPNLKRNFLIDNIGVLIILMSVFLFVVTYTLIGLLIYNYTSRSIRIRKKFKLVLNSLYIIFFGLLAVNLIGKKDLFDASIDFLNIPLFDHFPVIGWFKIMFISAIGHQHELFWYYTGLVFTTITVITLLVYKTKSDYYEDVLAATEYKEKMIQSKRAGDGSYMTLNQKAKNVKNKRMMTGGMAVFSKHMLELRKSGYFFINRNSIIIILVGVLSKYIFRGNGDFFSVMYLSVYLLFLLTMQQSKWMNELIKPYIYMIPANSVTKVFFSTLTDAIQNFINAVLLFVAAGLVFKAEPMSIVLSIFVYTSFGFVFLYSDVLSRKIFGGIHSKFLGVFLKILIVIFLIMPGFTAFFLAQVFLAGNPYIKEIMYLVLFFWNMFISLILLLLGRDLFERIDYQ